jgi:ferrous-iron efflux pump FieF
VTDGEIATPQRGTLTTRAAVASSALAIVLIGLKTYAAVQTSSMAMLGSLADSTLDLVASLIVLLGVRIAAAPADYEHRFGHGKAEAVAALVQVIIAIVLTIALISYQRHVVRKTGSLAIGTDRLHYSSDLLLNGSVIVALGLEQYAHLTGADAVFGLLIAFWLLWGAWSASGHALAQLMDREWPDELRERFLAAAREYPELAGLHDLRTRSSGTHYFAQFHVWVPGDWTVREAHDRLDAVEEALQHRFPGTEILIHVDPEGQIDRETLLPQEITERAT